jgi:threonine dehydrogenase-like Zn-dependent dehydrogenase
MIGASGNGGEGADAYIDFSSAAAAESTHITAALSVLRPFGKAVFMGGIWGHVKLEYNVIMMKSLRIQVRHQHHLAGRKISHCDTIRVDSCMTDTWWCK